MMSWYWVMSVSAPDQEMIYPMCDPQPAQVDCRLVTCTFHDGKGTCTNPAPAITLNETGTALCWSRKIKKEDEGDG